MKFFNPVLAAAACMLCLTFNDDDSTGVFTPIEYYTLHNCWKQEKDAKKNLAFYPFIISSILSIPKEKSRTMPIRLQYPARYNETVIVKLPVNCGKIEDEIHLKNEGFAYNAHYYNIGDRMYMKANYESFKDHVTTQESAAYLADIHTYNNNEEYAFSDSGADRDGASGRRRDTGGIWLPIVIVAGFAGWIIWHTRRA